MTTSPTVTTPPIVTPPKKTKFDLNLQTVGSSTGTGATNIFQFQPKTTDVTQLTQSSPQDITSMINAAMQQLTGRFATSEEIQKYGSELLAAQRANPGSYHSELNYDPRTSKPLTSVGTQLNAGVDAQSFIANLINGTGEARDYRAATGYFDAMRQSNEKFRGSLNG